MIDKVCCQIQAKILEDIDNGRIPASVNSFEVLREFVDANEYGDFYDDDFIETMINNHFNGRDEDGSMPQSYLTFMDSCQSRVDIWLKSGDHHPHPATDTNITN